MKTFPLWLVVILALLAMTTIGREDFFPTSIKAHETTKEDEKMIGENWPKIINPNLALFQMFFYTKEEGKYSLLYESSKEFLGPAMITLIGSNANSKVAKQIIRILKQEGILAEKGEVNKQPYNICQVINLPQGVFPEQLGRFLKGMAEYFYHLELKNCLFVPDSPRAGTFLLFSVVF
jgi:hypothetical protein